MIRKRAAMPEITDNGQSLVDRYRNERRVELAFKDHRYFDVRRWMIGPEAYQEEKGVSIRCKADAAGNPVAPLSHYFIFWSSLLPERHANGQVR